MILLTLNDLRNEMENCTAYENSFVYKGVEYGLVRNAKDGSYYFGLCNTLDDHGRTFPDFDSAVNALLIDGHSIAELMPQLNWT